MLQPPCRCMGERDVSRHAIPDRNSEPRAAAGAVCCFRLREPDRQREAVGQPWGGAVAAAAAAEDILQTLRLL